MVMKHYPPEFKADAVVLYRSRLDATVRSVAEDLGVNPQTLRSWGRLADGRRSGPAVLRSDPVVAGPAGSVEVENAQLRRRVRELEEERDLLRKATRCFAGQTRW